MGIGSCRSLALNSHFDGITQVRVLGADPVVAPDPLGESAPRSVLAVRDDQPRSRRGDGREPVEKSLLIDVRAEPAVSGPFRQPI
jgi:hypothetical protein